jgi:hypothetical protein
MKQDNPKTYQVLALDNPGSQWWKDADMAKVDCFPWGTMGEGDYRPATFARLGTDGSSLLVYMETDETNLRAETKGFGHVHTDSCMEFFVSPMDFRGKSDSSSSSSRKYLNFEFNPAGAMYLSIGTSRYDREVLPIDNFAELFQVRTAVHEKGWNLEFHIPLSFLKGFFPGLELKPGLCMRGNFYKCGDKTARPHFGCWSPIDLPKPDFHCPDFFGILELR